MCEIKCTQTTFLANKYFFCIPDRKWGLIATTFVHCLIFFVGLIMSIVEMNSYFTDRIGYNEILKETIPVGSQNNRYLLEYICRIILEEMKYQIYLLNIFLKTFLKELSCPNKTANATCGPMRDVLIFSVCYLLLGILVNILMAAAVVWNRSFFCIPWLVYQLIMSFMLIIGPFILLYYNVPDWNRVEKRNGIVADYPERWQNLVMIVPNLFGILCLYIFCHGMLVMEEMKPKEEPKVEPKKEEPKEEPKPSIYGAPQITVYAGPAIPPSPAKSPLPSAPPKVVD